MSIDGIYAPSLNIGCGNNYRPGFINIDGYNRNAADLLCDMVQFPFKKDVFEKIECRHVIEHTGFIGATYLIGECYRILKKGKVLLIETPDIEFSFEKFLHIKSPVSRSVLLSWVFGLDSPGMSHKLLYPEPLLKKMLLGAGFYNINSKKVRRGRLGACIVVECRKGGSNFHKMMSLFRSMLLDSNIVNIKNHLEAFEFEKEFIGNIRNFERSNSRVSILQNLIISPSAVKLFISARRKIYGEISDDLKNIERVSEILEKLRFTQRLYHCFIRLLEKPGNLEWKGSGFDSVVRRAMKLLLKFLNGDKGIRRKIKKNFPLTGTFIKFENRLFFSRNATQNIVRLLEAKGTKLMVLKKYDMAERFFAMAINSCLCDSRSILNYAVIIALKGNYRTAFRMYLNLINSAADAFIKRIAQEEMIKCLLRLKSKREMLNEIKKVRSKKLKELCRNAVCRQTVSTALPLRTSPV